jgi:chitosanase
MLLVVLSIDLWIRFKNNSDNKMYYAIFGDTNGDDPETIGEASWLLGTACFPNDGISGGKGHDQADVTCEFPPSQCISWMTFDGAVSSVVLKTDIVFTGADAVLPKSALNTNFVTNFGTLKSMGDKLMGQLSENLGISG